ncbi:MAG: membrane protein insertase YidC [Pseudomonadota bacterium]|nr:membrane protein insertase YidC [Pseudomonadota bacterium]
MDQLRIALYIALAFLLLLLFQRWESYSASEPEAIAVPEKPAADLAARRAADEPLKPISEIPEQATPDTPNTQDFSEEGQQVVVQTDLLRVVVNTLGGTLERVELLDYPVSGKEPRRPFALLSDGPDRYYQIRSGLVDRTGRAPDHRAHYQSDITDLTLAPGQNEVTLPLEWRGRDGLLVRKVLVFPRGRHQIDQRFEIANRGAQDWSGSVYSQILRRPGQQKRNFFQPVSFQGAAYYLPDEGFTKQDYEEIRKEPLDRPAVNGWVGMLEHYFVSAILPARDQQRRFFSQALSGERYAIGVQSDEVTVPPGGTATLETSFYVGPKLQSALKEAAEGLVLSVDYGVLTALAQPLFWLLNWIHGLVGNWGFAIIIVTLLIKLAFYQLSASSYRSMAKMRKLQPRLMALRERYGDDRQAMSQKMMELYKEEKFNPLGGCLPIVVQIPVFIALYWVLLESVELRQAPFIGWIDDLSAKDPYFILPALMCLSMVAQQRLNPAPLDPVQQKVMTFMPLVFGVLFALFPAGLVLYWLCNNLISIAQQWLITRNVERARA